MPPSHSGVLSERSKAWAVWAAVVGVVVSRVEGRPVGGGWRCGEEGAESGRMVSGVAAVVVVEVGVWVGSSGVSVVVGEFFSLRVVVMTREM